MQVWSGASSAVSTQAQAVSPLHALSQRNIYAGHVCVAGSVTETMIHFHVVAVAATFVGHFDHHAVSGDVDRVACREGEVHAGMPAGEAQEGIGPESETTGQPIR